MRNLLAIAGLFLTACMGVEQGMKIEKDLEADRAHRKALVDAEKERTEKVTKMAGQLEHIEADSRDAAKAQWERINEEIAKIPAAMDKKVEPLLPAAFFEAAMKVWRGEITTFTKLLGEYEAKLNAEEKNDDRIANFLGLLGKTFAELKVAPLEAKVNTHIQAQQADARKLEERLGRLEARAIEAGSKADAAKEQAIKTEATWDSAVVSKIEATGNNQFWMVVMFIALLLAFLLYVLRDHIRIPFIGKKEPK